MQRVTHTQPWGLGVQGSPRPHFYQSRVVPHRMVLDGFPGAGEGRSVFSGIMRKFPEQEVGGKRWIWVGLSDGTKLALGQGLIVGLTRVSCRQHFNRIIV